MTTINHSAEFESVVATAYAHRIATLKYKSKAIEVDLTFADMAFEQEVTIDQNDSSGDNDNSLEDDENLMLSDPLEYEKRLKERSHED